MEGSWRSVRETLGPVRGTLASASVRSTLPQPACDRVSPFLTVDHYGPTRIPPGWHGEVQDHLHAGHEVLSILLQGELRHRDSAGNDVFLRPGDVQRMTTARGLIHREHVSPGFRRTGGVFHGVQIWIDLPPAVRRSDPAYHHVPATEIPSLDLGDERVVARLLTGSLERVTGPVETHLPVRVIHAFLEPGASIELDAPRTENALLYVVEGRLTLTGSDSRVDEPARLVVFDRDGTRLGATAEAPSQLLVLQGAPRPGDLARDGSVIMDRPEEVAETRRAHAEGRLGRIEG